MNDRVCGIAVKLGCEVLLDEELSAYTTMRVGGRCGCIIKANSAKDISELVCAMNEEKEAFFVLGKGSNVIASDKGYSGTVIMLGAGLSDITVSGDSLVCGGGVSLMKLCRTALDCELSGLEFAYGIPGTAGGAVYMNAGAYSGEIKDVIEYAEGVDPVTGKLKRFELEEMDLSYRHSVFMKNKFIITSAAFRLDKGSGSAIEKKMNELLQKRRDKQPLEFPSAGSTFKRPQGSYASLLIDECGLKGLSVGDAEVSRKHCGFIINKGNATADDILKLIETVREEVYKKTGYLLECEPVILG